MVSLQMKNILGRMSMSILKSMSSSQDAESEVEGDRGRVCGRR